MKYLPTIVMFISLVFSTGNVVLAQTTPLSDPGVTTPAANAKSVTLDNPITANNITELFQTILDVVMVFAIPIIVFFIILAGFKYVTARGNENTISEAHMALLYALIGGLLVLGARVLIEVIGGTVNSVINN